jgi:radical SAM superfamily enzyme YgiQ (UPF0313 family)
MTWQRVLCLYPYAPDKKSEQLYGGAAFINPIGLEVVATAAARHADVMLVDLRVEKEPLKQLIDRFRPDMIVVSLNWGRDDHVDKVIASLPGSVSLMIGGIHPTHHPDAYLKAYPQVDMLALGYGEKTIAELLSHGSPEGVKGLWFRQRTTAWPPGASPSFSSGAGGDEVIRNPDRHGVDPESFHIDRSLRRQPYPFMGLKGDNIATSIGCPMVCAFCGWRTNVYGELQKWIPRSAEDVVQEIAETDADIVHIVDANFAHDPLRVEAICDLIIRRGIKRLLLCEIRVNALAHSAALVRKMERAGFVMFMVGVEAADDAVLKALRKGYSVKMARKAFEHLRQTRILTFGNFLIGVPGQTPEGMVAIADYARELGLDFISPNKLYAYPGSTFREWVLSHPGCRIEGRRHYVTSAGIDLHRLRNIQRDIYLRFYRPNRLLKSYRKLMTHPMVARVGRKKIRQAVNRILLGHVLNPRFRRRLVKKAAGRFRRD